MWGFGKSLCVINTGPREVKEKWSFVRRMPLVCNWCSFLGGFVVLTVMTSTKARPVFICSTSQGIVSFCWHVKLWWTPKEVSCSQPSWLNISREWTLLFIKYAPLTHTHTHTHTQNHPPTHTDRCVTVFFSLSPSVLMLFPPKLFSLI